MVNPGDYIVPFYNEGEIYWDFTTDDIPANAIVTHIDASLEASAMWVDGLSVDIYKDQDSSNRYNIYKGTSQPPFNFYDPFTDISVYKNGVNTIHFFDGKQAPGTYRFVAKDTKNRNCNWFGGNIGACYDQYTRGGIFELTLIVYYEVPTYTINGLISTWTPGQDADNDGYYETYNFNVAADSSINVGSRTVTAKAVCTNCAAPANEWWFPKSWTLYGGANPVRYNKYLSEANFSGQNLINKDLQFLVELWDADKTTKLATSPQFNGGVKVDNQQAFSLAATANWNGLSDVDGDGYWDEFSLSINATSSISLGSESALLKIIARDASTGSEFLEDLHVVSLISGSQVIKTSFLDNFDFYPINGNTNLDFSAELWDLSETRQLAIAENVANEYLAKADQYFEIYNGEYGGTGPIILNLVVTDSNNDGFAEQFSFDVEIDPDVYAGNAIVRAKIICNQTGEFFWSDTFSVIDYNLDHYRIPFSSVDFLRNQDGLKELTFTAELWDAAELHLLTPGRSVAVAGSVKADLSPTYVITNPHIENNASLDTDGDGYYEELSFDIVFDPDVDIETAQVKAKIHCTTTGQDFWVSPAWDIHWAESGDSRSVHFADANFAGNFTGKSDLTFKIELFDATGAVSLAPAVDVLGGPINADVHFDYPNLTLMPSLSFYGYSDSNNDGYFESFDAFVHFDVVSADKIYVFPRLRCTTTGQEWPGKRVYTKFSTLVENEDPLYDWYDHGYWYLPFTFTIDKNSLLNFADNSDLEFVVDLYDPDNQNLFASAPVSGGPLKAGIYYEIATAQVVNWTPGADADGDGYYETFNFQIAVDADTELDPLNVYFKIISNTTGQSRWSDSSKTLHGAVNTDTYYSNWWTEADFAGFITGNTELNFTVELYDATKTKLLDRAVVTPSGLVKVDYIEPCPAITSLTTSASTISPLEGDYATVTGTIDFARPYTWELSIADMVVNGDQATVVSATWGGKDAEGRALTPGLYSATLTAANAEGTCVVSDDIPVTVTGTVNNAPSQDLMQVCLNSAGNVASGNLSHGQRLFATDGAPLATAIDLSYDSLSPDDQPLGLGWSHTYDIRLVLQGNGSVSLFAGGESRVYTLSGGSFVSPPGDHSTLVKNADGTYALAHRSGLTYRFDTAGRLAAVADRFNNTASLDRSVANRTTIIDPAGRSTTIAFDGATGRIAFVTDPAQKVYDFAYHPGTNRLWKVIYPEPTPGAGRPTWEYLYDAAGFMEYKTDPEGQTVKYVYDAEHRVKETINPEGVIDTAGAVIAEGHTKALSYSPSTGTTSFTNQNGAVSQYAYDARKGVLLSKTGPDGGKVSYTYYADGNIETRTEPVDADTAYVTKYLYDAYGNVTDVTGHARHYTFNGSGQVIATTDDALDLHLGYAYDYANFDQVKSITDYLSTPPALTSIVYDTDAGYRRTTVTDPTARRTVTRLNANGTVHDVEDGNGLTTTFGYYPSGALQSVTDPAGVKTEYADYDAAGRPKTVKLYDAAGVLRQTTTLEYDDLGRLIASTVAGATGTFVTRFGYDRNGNRTSVTDAEGHTTTYEVNYKGQVTKATDALLKPTIFEFSGCQSCGGVNQLTAVVDANQHRTAFEYDPSGRLQKEIDPLGKTLRYTYYPSGLVHEKIDDATNQVLLTYVYTADGELTSKTDKDGSVTSFTYYPNGRLNTAANAAISYTFDWYANGWLKSVTDSNGRIVRYDAYDGIGRPDLVTLLPGTAEQRVLDYGYDIQGRLATIASAAGAFTFGYDDLSRRGSLTYPNGVTATYGYHPDTGWLTSLVYRNTSGVDLVNLGYPEHDKVGNRRQRTEDGVSTTYAYDDVYQLTQAKTGASEENFVYDAVGNRRAGPTVKEVLGQTYVHDDANRMLEGRKFEYAYDDFGNQQYRYLDAAHTKFWQYTWDGENRLARAELKKGAQVLRTVSFKYDPFGRRIEKKVDDDAGTVTRTYVYDGEDIALEFVSDGTTTTSAHTIHGPGIDEPLARVSGGQSAYYHADGLGSIVAITNSAQDVVQRYGYESFGMVTASDPAFENAYTYTGREWDKEIGLYYYRARYFDPMEGRFISRDPIGFAGGDVNVYRYVSNMSISLADPNGLNPYWHAAQSLFYRLAPYANRTAVAISRYAQIAYRNFANSPCANFIQGPFGKVSEDTLTGLLKSPGPTTEVVTRLTQAPIAGRALSVATGQSAQALANVAREGGQIFSAKIPTSFISAAERVGLATISRTQMGNNVLATEIRFHPQITRFIVEYFE